LSDTLLAGRANTRALDAYVVACAFDRAGANVAFALGDGTTRIVTPGGEWASVQAHDGGILALAPDTGASGFITGDDDGVLARIGPDLSVTRLQAFGSRWVEQVASFADSKTALLACSVGKIVTLFDASGAALKTLEHPSTVTGLAFDARGKRLAASHYNGASLWFTNATSPTPRLLEWKGSHTGIALHPAGEALVTAMQENALHGWRLPGGEHMRMSGYPSKCESLGFTRNGRWLASAGADAIVLWPFFGGGPTGKPPAELAPIEGIVVTRIACHPQTDMVAAGYKDGTVVLADIATKRILPLAPATGSPITALAWSPTGAHLAYGTEAGTASVLHLGK
jgi:WD40 repeat protein